MRETRETVGFYPQALILKAVGVHSRVPESNTHHLTITALIIPRLVVAV